MEESFFFNSFRIRASETDASRRIKIPDLINCLQEAAWSNATKLGFSTYDMLENEITWVLNRMYIEFIELPMFPQTIDVETWPSGMDKYFAFRDFRVFDEKNILLARATSNWLVVDINTRKLIPIPDYVKEARFPVNRGGMDRISGKCTYDDSKTEREFSADVSWFDLDVNEHVNNTKYFQWILDSLDSKILANKKPTSIDITFKAEIGYGEEMMSGSYATEPNCFAHRIVNASSGKVLAVARSEFE